MKHLIVTSIIMGESARTPAGILIPPQTLMPGVHAEDSFADHPGTKAAVERAIRKGGAYWKDSAPVTKTVEEAVINLPKGTGDLEDAHVVMTPTKSEVRPGLKRGGDRATVASEAAPAE